MKRFNNLDGSMKKLLMMTSILIMPFLEAKVELNHLIECNKSECFEKLKTTKDEELWSIFLEGQTHLFFNSEANWIRKGEWWQKAQHILELGSGDGSYLNKLSDMFQNKTFTGIEILSTSVEHANAKYAKKHLHYEEGNAEIYNPQFKNSADLILFRLTLQHLKDPILALKHAADYLSSDGYVVIIESFDEVKQTSHPISAIDNALNLAAEIQKSKGKGNRKISFELFQGIEEGNSPLGELFEVAYSNLDLDRNVRGDTVRFEGEKDRKQYFNHNILFAELLHRTYQIPVDLNKAYDELQNYLKDEEAWTSPGEHFLVLKKKSSF